MFIREFKSQTRHVRKSKTGKEHTYSRDVTLVVMRCDNCNTEFERSRSKMGVTKKNIWDMPASSGLDISKL